MGIFSPETISVGDLFVGAVIPGLLLVCLYIVYMALIAFLKPEAMPAIPRAAHESSNHLVEDVLTSLLPPIILIVMVLGSIIGGFATPTEAAAIGAVGAMVLAAVKKQLNRENLTEVVRSTTRVTSMVFMILIGASLFSLVFRGFGGDERVQELLTDLPGGIFTAVFVVMLVMFLLGFVLDFIEITFVIVPMVGPVLMAMGLDPLWLGVMIALNLQTSFLTPPFGFSLFYLRGVAPPAVKTIDIYKGVVPFIMLQLVALGIVGYLPSLVNYLPTRLSLLGEQSPPPINPKLQTCIEETVFTRFQNEGDRIRSAITAARGLDMSVVP